MPLAMQLALGTFKLEDTDHPVSAEQAKELLPLWKAMRSLGNSETYAEQELEAVIKQIQGTMTPEQMADIEAMQLSFGDMQTIAQKYGLELGRGGQFGNLSPEMQATMEARRESGQMPAGGGFPGGGPGGFPGEGGPPGQGGFGPQAGQTPQAGRSGISAGVNPALLDAVIEFLQAKTG